MMEYLHCTTKLEKRNPFCLWRVIQKLAKFEDADMIEIIQNIV